MFFMTYLVRPFVSYLVINNWFINQFVIIILTLGLSVSMIHIAKKINKRIAIKYFGF